ncbi:hypothetical protein H6P81_015672 [Aristolochia fimbriata]|uniref:non-specific serine/threonine protein kinase n=1 Tax=Aristolochia fimbriata TaxID=158543 RepID=A0AAV7E9C2_ARIFI|nr:hypothetical protein H6P81_015672 [Aristolochia fimbriata]
MDFSSRVYNKATVDYSNSRKIPIKTLTSPENRKKGKTSTKEWVLKSFYNKPKAVDVRSASRSPNLRPPPSKTSTRIETPDRKGEPSISFAESLVNSRAEKFKFCLVGRFVGSRPPLALIREWFGAQLKLKGEWSVTLLDRSHVFLKLANQEDMVHVWARKRWFIKGSLMKVFKWSPFFRTADGEEPSLAAVWVSFPSLPVVLFQEEFLFDIAALVGKALTMDGATRNMTRTNVARVCVEIDLLKELPKRLWIRIGKRGFSQEIAYENLPSYCTRCLLQGHSSKTCNRGPKDSAKEEQLLGQPSQEKIDNHIKQEGSSVLRHTEDERRKNKDETETENREKTSGMQIIKQSPSVSEPKMESRSWKEIIEKAILEKAKDTVELEEESSPQGNTDDENSTGERKGKTESESLLKSEPTEPITIRKNTDKRRRFVPSKKLFFFWNRRMKEARAMSLERAIGPVGLQRYKYSEIKRITRTFLEVLGRGGFSTVYKGRLQDGSLVAIKIPSSVGGEEEFISEVTIIARTHHVNVVRLLGFCSERSHRALVYEYMPNGSLDRFIHAEDESRLGWVRLLQIAIGIAGGLLYLHDGCSIQIVHSDIKPRNILLDENFNPKIGDFGLARTWHYTSSKTSIVRGTVGYIAPEHLLGLKGTAKSDVYSYGVLLLEMAVRRKPLDRTIEDSGDQYLLEWVHRKANRQPRPGLGLGGIAGVAEGEEARKMILVGLWCIQHDPSKRPSMNEVVQMLLGDNDALQMPPDPERNFYFSTLSSRYSADSETFTGKVKDEAASEVHDYDSDSSLRGR